MYLKANFLVVGLAFLGLTGCAGAEPVEDDVSGEEGQAQSQLFCYVSAIGKVRTFGAAASARLPNGTTLTFSSPQPPQQFWPAGPGTNRRWQLLLSSRTLGQSQQAWLYWDGAKSHTMFPAKASECNW